MKRHIINNLVAWKNSKRRKPLVLQGARQVGKTYILNYFAQTEYDNYIYINFDENTDVANFFETKIQPANIVTKLEIHFDIKIKPHKTLIIFDEIQECPNALNSLKYFNEQANQFHIVAAGSLLGVKLKRTKSGFPVGKVNFLNLKPMTFFEFLDALGKIKLIQYLEDLRTPEPISPPIHNQLIELLKVYYFVGGMPEAVKSYVESNDLNEVRDIHKEILNAYVLDFSKHAPPNQVMKIMTIWNAIPSQLAKENKRFVFSAISKSARAREYEIAIQWLIDAGIIYKSHHISTPKIPLPHYGDDSAFKIFVLDVGLLGAMSDLPKQLVIQDHRLFSEFKGALTENFVAQELLASHFSSLYYWTSGNKAEVDFIISYELNILPIEVKCGFSKHAKSLKAYSDKYNPDLLFKTNLNNLKKDAKVINYPLYLIKRIPEL